MPGRYARFWSWLPCRRTAPIVYIWAWQAAEWPPERLISSMITPASLSPSPSPPYSRRDERCEMARVGQRVDELLRVGALLVEAPPVLAGNRAHSSRTSARSSGWDRWSVMSGSSRRLGWQGQDDRSGAVLSDRWRVSGRWRTSTSATTRVIAAR